MGHVSVDVVTRLNVTAAGDGAQRIGLGICTDCLVIPEIPVPACAKGAAVDGQDVVPIGEARLMGGW